MSYSVKTVIVPVRFSATSTLTATASGHVVTATDQAEMVSFPTACTVKRVRVKTLTAPVPTTVSLNFLNGTNTFAVVTPAAAGTSTDATLTAANVHFAADGEPKLTVIGTGTASASQIAGVYDIYFETQ
jgi:hypothetical protein